MMCSPLLYTKLVGTRTIDLTSCGTYVVTDDFLDRHSPDHDPFDVVLSKLPAISGPQCDLQYRAIESWPICAFRQAGRSEI